MLENEMEWPSGALFAAQDTDDSNVFWYREAPYKNAPKDKTWICRIGHTGSPKKLRDLASDHLEKIIDKSEYLLAGGWMGHDGNGSPVPKGAFVDAVWSDGDVSQFREGCGSGVAWIGGNPKILRYRILVEESKNNPADQEETKQGSKEAEGTCTIILKTGPVYVGARIMYQSPQTIVWEHKGVETACKAEYAIINPDRNQIASQVLYQLGKVSVSPVLMLELMKEMGWE